MLQHLSPGSGFDGFVCGSPAIRDALDIARRAALTDRSILLTGETGTGKGWMARFIHNSSPRSSKPFVVWSAPEETDALGRRQLFGHVRGAYTGADQESPGALAAADKGTLVLDDVDKTDLSLQGALLRFLDSSVYRRLGSSRDTPADVRLVITANRPFNNLIREELFLPDLAWRLKGLQIHMPPLRDRTEDLPLMIDHFASSFAQIHQVSPIRFTRSALKMLVGQSWPGNIRQLAGTLENLVFRAGNNGPIGVSAVKAALDDGFESPQRSPADRGSLDRETIVGALNAARWNSVEAADKLGVSLRTVRRRMSLFGLVKRRRLPVRI
jgi:DNA-binding NtrC family response regulator